MGLHEMAIGGIYISPLLVFAILALPVTKGALVLIHKTSLPKWIWHEMLFICGLYIIIFTIITLLLGALF